LKKQPTAWIPLLMSTAALVIVLLHVGLFGAARQADEGTAAHLFQILIAAQLPFVAFFAIKWLPKDGWHGLRVLAIQAAAVLVACAPVYFLHL
jgi:hypothetical protein